MFIKPLVGMKMRLVQSKNSGNEVFLLYLDGSMDKVILSKSFRSRNAVKRMFTQYHNAETFTALNGNLKWTDPERPYLTMEEWDNEGKTMAYITGNDRLIVKDPSVVNYLHTQMAAPKKTLDVNYVTLKAYYYMMVKSGIKASFHSLKGKVQSSWDKENKKEKEDAIIKGIKKDNSNFFIKKSSAWPGDPRDGSGLWYPSEEEQEYALEYMRKKIEANNLHIEYSSLDKIAETVSNRDDQIYYLVKAQETLGKINEIKKTFCADVGIPCKFFKDRLFLVSYTAYGKENQYEMDRTGLIKLLSENPGMTIKFHVCSFRTAD